MESEWLYYWCHACKLEFRGIANADLKCFHCSSQLVEEIQEHSAHPSNFVAEMPPRQRPSMISFRFGVPVANLEVLESFLDIRRRQLGVTEDALQQCSVVYFEELPKELAECSVCKEDFQKDTDFLMLPCDHIFHKDCIVQWLRQRNSCPVCRFALPSN